MGLWSRGRFTEQSGVAVLRSRAARASGRYSGEEGGDGPGTGARAVSESVVRSERAKRGADRWGQAWQEGECASARSADGSDSLRLPGGAAGSGSEARAAALAGKRGRWVRQRRGERAGVLRGTVRLTRGGRLSAVGKRARLRWLSAAMLDWGASVEGGVCWAAHLGRASWAARGEGVRGWARAVGWTEAGPRSRVGLLLGLGFAGFSSFLFFSFSN